MKQNPILIAIGAGLASAVLFVSIATNFVLAPFLGSIAALPLVICALGWGSKMGALSALTAGLGVAILKFSFTFEYVIFIIPPVLLLSHLAYLNRSVPDSVTNDHKIEWYPVERLLIWICIIAICLALFSLSMIATSYEGYKSSMETLVNTVFKDIPKEAMTQDQFSLLKKLILEALPMILSINWFWITLFNLWLGAKIVHMSGLLKRPWPSLADCVIPAYWGIAFLVSLLAVSVTTGYPHLMATAVMGGLYILYIFAGLAVVHYILRNADYKFMALTAVYSFTLLLGWPSLILLIIGLGEPFFNLRRFAVPPSPSGPAF